MKKSYVKPEVTLVRFELSEAIASCSTKLYNNHSSECGISPEMEAIMAVSGANLTAESNCSTPLEGYCYFTSAEGMLKLMNS